MDKPTALLGEILEALKRSDEKKIEGMIYGINLPPDAFEMIVPMFRELYGLDLKASIIPLGELEEYQMHYVKMAPRSVRDALEWAVKLEYEIIDGQEKVSGNLSFPVYFVDGAYRILLVGGSA